MELRRYGTNPLNEARAEAFESVDKRRRYKEILDILEDNVEGLTAKEIAVEMYNRGFTPSSERNFSSPRLNELLKVGKVDVIGKKKCSYTGKTVTVFKVIQ